MQGLGKCKQLAELDLSHNALETLAAVRPLSMNLKLRSLNVIGNHLLEHPTKNRAVQLLHMIPSITVLNDHPTHTSTAQVRHTGSYSAIYRYVYLKVVVWV